MTTSRAPAPPELVDARASLTAARREERKLARQLDSTGGLDLFAGLEGSLTAQLEAARAEVARCEELVNDLRPGRSRFRVVRDTPAAAAADAEVPSAVVTAKPAPEHAVNPVDPAPVADPGALPEVTEVSQAAATVSFLRPAPIGPLLAEVDALASVVNDPERPQGVEPLRARLAGELAHDCDRALAMRAARLSVPASLRGQFTDPILLLESRMLADWHRLRDFDRPDHPAAVAQQAWDAEHPGVDARLEAARTTLAAAVTEAAQQAMAVPALPPGVSDAGRALWVDAAARQLAYRERYDVADPSPLGAEPWDPEQRLAWDRARKALGNVGVEVESRAEAAERLQREVAAASVRRSLNSVLDHGVEGLAAAR